MDAEEIILKGAEEFQLGNTCSAEGWFRLAVKRYPDFQPAHFGLAEILWAQKNYKGAVYGFRRAVELDPYFALAHFNLAVCYDNLGMLRQCMFSLRRALELKTMTHAVATEARRRYQELVRHDRLQIVWRNPEHIEKTPPAELFEVQPVYLVSSVDEFIRITEAR